MTSELIPETVRRLIAERIDSVPELEAVLLFHLDGGAREWTADEAGRRLYVSTMVARYVLNLLTERGFFVAIGDRYRYAPESPDLAATIDLLAAAYSQHLVAVTHLIHAKPSEKVRDFANAFRFRKPN